ncbi:hypothetical protein [Ktedonospora formicarum]|uniref:Uncharacterized protein n=1 Tax=Ktedonospora formicarum TaxID=2778364 RepID=A0A8J3I383_9CHLR|nr:hypothetical protein [Ktedonospora formicarum]GHO45198.1 hypothetical protein KSX_33610 [Ktedonospora formicarum]
MKQHLTLTSLKQVQELAVLSKHYEAMLQTIQASLVKVVQDDTGIDVSSGEWHLDTDTGAIEHGTAD